MKTIAPTEAAMPPSMYKETIVDLSGDPSSMTSRRVQ